MVETTSLWLSTYRPLENRKEASTWTWGCEGLGRPGQKIELYVGDLDLRKPLLEDIGLNASDPPTNTGGWTFKLNR